MHIPESGRRFHLAAIHFSILLLYPLSTPLAAADRLAAEDSSEETVTVTGSRIQRSDVTAISPVVKIDAKEIERSGTVNAESLLRTLPQTRAGIGSGNNRENPGVATINLRGLRHERTLILMDGKRLMPYDSGGIVDVNTIPVSLLQQVDIVTGGASAVYGSDAMAGVVNFILRKDFQGIQVDSNFARTDRGDGDSRYLGLTAGTNFARGRGNVTVFVSGTDRRGVRMTDRPWSEFPLTTSTGLPGGDIFYTSSGLYICSPGCFIPGVAGAQTLVKFLPNGDLTPFDFDATGFNYNDGALLQIPQERIQGGGLINFALNDAVDIYGRVNYAQNRLHASLAATPMGAGFDFPLAYFNDNTRQILQDRIDNVTSAAGPDGLIDPAYDTDNDGEIDPDAADSTALYRRITELGPRRNHNRSVTYQALGGLKGTLDNGWRWDASYQYGRTNLLQRYLNDIDRERAQMVLNGCPPGSPADCVPGTFFGAGSLNAAAAAFLSLNVSTRIITDQQVFTTSLSGNLDSLHIGDAAPVGFAVGAEYRRESSESSPDDCFSTPGCAAGFGSVQAVRNRYDVKEIFGEALVPLLAGARFAERLNFEAGVRLSDYSTAGRTNAFKAGADWAPLSPSLRLRATYQKAVRAPNIFEFGSPRQQVLGSASNDPCTGTVSDFVRALCIATGVPANRFTGNTSSVPPVSNGQINTFVGGNPNLNEEDSDTRTAGFVWTPDALPGMNMQFDWYRIRIDNAITSMQASDVLNTCYSQTLNPSGDPRSGTCTLISRNPTTGGLVGDPTYGVSEANANIAFLETEGFDLQFDYTLQTAGLGHFNFSLFGNYVMHNSRQISNELPVRECGGKYGSACGSSPDPKLRLNQRSTWSFGEFELGYRWRYLASTEFDTPTAAVPQFRRIGEQHYIDLTAGWKPERFAGLSAMLGVDNVFDRDPPLVGDEAGPTSQNNGNTYPSTFDVLGRMFFASVAKRF